jgi:hypothetical protein
MPRKGVNRSLSDPTQNGPSPKPNTELNKVLTDPAVARMPGGTTL